MNTDRSAGPVTDTASGPPRRRQQAHPRTAIGHSPSSPRTSPQTSLHFSVAQVGPIDKIHVHETHTLEPGPPSRAAEPTADRSSPDRIQGRALEEAARWIAHGHARDQRSGGAARPCPTPPRRGQPGRTRENAPGTSGTSRPSGRLAEFVVGALTVAATARPRWCRRPIRLGVTTRRVSWLHGPPPCPPGSPARSHDRRRGGRFDVRVASAPCNAS